MIAVKIELWPFGDEGRAKEIGRMYIANDGAGTHDRGDYVIGVCRRGTTDVPREIYQGADGFDDQPKAARAGEVKDYPRLAYNVWRLIARAVLAAFPEEAKRAKRDERTLLDDKVMRGLKYLAEHLENDGHTWLNGELEDVEAAIEWLAEANQR